MNCFLRKKILKKMKKLRGVEAPDKSNLIDISVEATIELHYDMGLFQLFERTVEIRKSLLPSLYNQKKN